MAQNTMKVQCTKMFDATFYTENKQLKPEWGRGGEAKDKGGEDQRGNTKMPTRGMAS